MYINNTAQPNLGFSFHFLFFRLGLVNFVIFLLRLPLGTFVSWALVSI
jgi:hypothetical protein